MMSQVEVQAINVNLPMSPCRAMPRHCNVTGNLIRWHVGVSNVHPSNWVAWPYFEKELTIEDAG